MSQNTSHAVMAQRSEPHDSLDFFPTPPWATRALCEFILQGDPKLGSKMAWEPACGQGHMSRALAEYFETVYSSDVHPYGFGAVRDFLFPEARLRNFCAAPTQAGSPYCPSHHERCYRKPEPAEKSEAA